MFILRPYTSQKGVFCRKIKVAISEGKIGGSLGDPADNDVMRDYKSVIEAERETAYILKTNLERHSHIWNWEISKWSDS